MKESLKQAEELAVARPTALLFEFIQIYADKWNISISRRREGEAKKGREKEKAPGVKLVRLMAT